MKHREELQDKDVNIMSFRFCSFFVFNWVALDYSDAMDEMDELNNELDELREDCNVLIMILNRCTNSFKTLSSTSFSWFMYILIFVSTLLVIPENPIFFSGFGSIYKTNQVSLTSIFLID